MRISKFPAMFGMGFDKHCVQPPSVPPPPPAPPNPAPVPFQNWIVTFICSPSQLIFGKFTQMNIGTEGMGDILMGHDWGMGQMHLPMPPILATPAIALCTVGASHKFFLPSYSVQEKPVGGALQVLGTSADSAVAINTPAFLMMVQDCWDVGVGGVGIVSPSGISFQAPSVRHVSVNIFDILAGVISMAGDAAGAAVSSKLGGAMFGNCSTAGQAVGGAALNAVNGLVGNWANAATSTTGEGVVVGITGISMIGLAPAGIGLISGKFADAVGGMGQPSS